MRFKLDEAVRDRIVAETRGNPLALLELPHGLTATQLAGGFGLLGAPALAGRIEESFVRRLDLLFDDGRRLLLVAAAEPVGDPLLLWRAAKRLGLGPADAEAAEAEGLLAIGGRVTFRHPLVRSAIYRSAAAEDRRAAHLALAEATDREADPDRRAWHLAAAAAGPDEQVALELERSAGRAQARGGLAAAAAFLRRAVALTNDPVRRADRALAAAQASLQAGEFDAALALAATAEAGALDEFQRARVDLLRAHVAFISFLDGDAPALLLKAARRLEPFDLEFARDTRGSPAMGCPIRRSAPGSSSARGPLSGICATCSPSSASNPGEGWRTHWPAPTPSWAWPDLKRREAPRRCTARTDLRAPTRPAETKRRYWARVPPAGRIRLQLTSACRRDQNPRGATPGSNPVGDPGNRPRVFHRRGPRTRRAGFMS